MKARRNRNQNNPATWFRVERNQRRNLKASMVNNKTRDFEFVTFDLDDGFRENFVLKKFPEIKGKTNSPEFWSNKKNTDDA